MLDLLKAYEVSIKEGTHVPARVQRSIPPQVGQVREVWSVPVERFVIVSEVGDGLYKTVPLTSYLQLLPRNAPLYELLSAGLRLGALPLWDYLRAEFIEEYTNPIGRISPQELEKIKKYVNSTDRGSLDYVVKRFIRLNSKRWARWTMYSLLSHEDEVDEQSVTIIELTQDIQSKLSTYKTHALADKYFKGKNFFGVRTEEGLRLYLPSELIGRKVRIAVGDAVLFEGELQDIRIEFVGDFQSINLKEVLRIVEEG
ncbi:MAG: hypothetical protein RMI01_09100 [Thermodesulfovibrio sp.]|nr:hypothetical protein [Thermodesulfovibrio sp.]